MDKNIVCTVTDKLARSGVGVINNNAGRALPTLIAEDSLHATFLAREDIACLSSGEQASLWVEQKECIAKFFKMLEGVPLYGKK